MRSELSSAHLVRGSPYSKPTPTLGSFPTTLFRSLLLSNTKNTDTNGENKRSGCTKLVALRATQSQLTSVQQEYLNGLALM